jgi:excisionase family DNA binding protein
MILNDRDKEMGPLATVAEAALQLGVKDVTVRGWILARKIEYVKLLGHSVRIKQSTIDAIIAEGTVEPLSFDDFNKPSIQRRALKLAA